MKTMIIVAHLDDESLGMGGTLMKMCKNNPYNIRLVSLCTGRDEENSKERIKAFKKNIKSLGCSYSIFTNRDMTLDMISLKDITKEIETTIDEFQPERIFTTSESDIHQDHQIVSKAVKIACRPSRSKIKELYEMKIPNNEPFSPTYYDTIIDISDVIEDKKKLCKRYKTENINIEEIQNKEYFRTIYRNLSV